MERGGLYIAKEARVGGFGGFSERTIAIEWLRSGEGLGEVLVGCEERARAEGREEKRGPATVSEYRKRLTLDRLYRGYIFNGWAVKRTPNATKLGRRPVYTIIIPHDKLQPIPRTFLCQL